MSDPADAQRLVEEAGDLDVLVNNAGLTRDGLIARMSDEDWRVVLDTNLGGVFHTCRAVARGMMKRRAGAIVNVSSIVGLHGNPGQTNYAASKAGIIGFTKSLARELGTRGVRANVVAPGLRADAADRRPRRGAHRRDAREHAARPARRAGGHRRRGTLPLLRRGLVHHGRGAARRRRTGDVSSTATDDRRVVITGLGAVSPLGNDIATTLGRACSRASPAPAEIRRSTRASSRSTSPAS